MADTVLTRDEENPDKVQQENLPTTPSSPTNALEKQRAIASLRLLLGQTLKITIQDTRSFIGTFVCTDRERNVILVNTNEFLEAGDEGGRYVGMVMIPWKYVVDVGARMGGGSRLSEVQDYGYI